MFNCYLNVLLTSWLITCVFSQSEIVCRTTELPWNDAIKNCLVIGEPMSFHGVTGLNIENINLRPDVTVWTSDFIYSDQHHQGGCLCSFRYLTKETLFEIGDELFSYCDDFKYYFCENKTNNIVQVLNNTWDNASRCGFFSPYYHFNIVKPGFYWIRKTSECGFHEVASSSTENVWQSKAILCGAYSKGAGRHFRRCNTNHKQVCVSSGTGLRSVLFDDSCLIATTTGTTELPKVTTLVSRSIQPQMTKTSENVTSSTSETNHSVRVSHTYSSNLPTTDYVTQSVSMTKLSQTSMRTIQNTSETQIINSTFLNAKDSAHQQGGPNKGTDAGSIAGIVVGVCLALAGGIVLFILIHRRYRCNFDKNTTSNSMPNNGSSILSKKPKASSTLFNNLAYDSWNDNQKQNRTKRNNKDSPNNGTYNQHHSVEDKEPYYNQTNAMYMNDITKQQTTEASSYSFAEETESDVREKDMSLDEYDTTISPRKGLYKSENLYNKFEPVNNSSDVYDSTLSQGKSFETDDVYNKLSCNTKNGKFGTTLNEDYDSVGNTSKNQNIQHCTDNVYN